jgi:RimJ/RimL family protein N-acetyltransferase
MHGSKALSMPEAATFSSVESLRNGRSVEIRALTPGDQTGLAAALERASAESFYRRFFGVKRELGEKEVEFFMNVDFVNHVALVAVTQEGRGPIIVGGARYVVVRPGTAELAFAVVDEYQGQGIGSLLLRHLVDLARRAGLEELIAEVLPENTPMLKVFEKSGLALEMKHEAGVVHLALRLAPRAPAS